MAENIRTIRTPRHYYEEMPTEQRQCRGRRFHYFPDLDPKADRLPDGYRITGLGRKLYECEQACQNECGVSRFILYKFERGKFRRLQVDGHLVPPKYRHPDDWVTAPMGTLSSAVITEFILDDCVDLLLRAAKESA